MRRRQIKSVTVGDRISSVEGEFDVIRNEPITGSDGEVLYHRVYLRSGDEPCRVTYLPAPKEVTVL